jgi:hypothetical protein
MRDKDQIRAQISFRDISELGERPGLMCATYNLAKRRHQSATSARLELFRVPYAAEHEAVSN